MLDTAYVYLTLAELHAGLLVHLISGMDEDAAPSLAAGASATAITGYTEWISEGGPVVTIGWDWEMRVAADRVRLQRVSLPSSNVMLQSPARRDLGHATTVQLLKDYVDTFAWQDATLVHITGRYPA